MEPGKPDRTRCDDLRESIAWYPTGDLDAGTRRQVENHVAGCDSCAGLLRFATTLQDDLRAESGAAEAIHPLPEAIVRFSENPAELDPLERSRIEEHLAACGECTQEVSLLKTVTADLPPTDLSYRPTVAPGRAAAESLVDRLRAIWNVLAGSVLKPVPATAYLAVALGLAAFLALRTGSREDRIQEQRTGVSVTHPGILLGGVTLLPDQYREIRGTPGRAEPAAVILADKDQFLMCELTGLGGPPAPAEAYTLQILATGASTPSWEGVIRGAAFGESYTVGLLLNAGTLQPGRYTVRIQDPKGATVYQSPLEVR